LLRFGREEFLLVTGFLFGPLPDHVVVDRSPFALRIFPHKQFDRKVTVKGNELLHILNNDKVFDALPTEDAVRVCLLICAEVIFTGRGTMYLINFCSSLRILMLGMLIHGESTCGDVCTQV
jgi:hypothetical protein